MHTITTTHEEIDGLNCTVWAAQIDGAQVGHLDVHTSGLIIGIEVDEDMRGQGIARDLYEAATAAGTVYHVPAWGRTYEGSMFAESVGGPEIDDQEACTILQIDDVDVVTGAMWD